MEKITKPKIIKISIYISLLTFLPGLIIGLLIAINYGPTDYSIFHNYISNLGSKQYTPAPFILDLTLTISAIFFIPLILNLYQINSSDSSDNIDNSKRINNMNLSRRKFGYVGISFLIIGCVGMFNVGVFSMDRNQWNLHYIFSSLSFGGFTFGSFFTGIAIILKKIHIPRKIGLFMVFGPSTAAIIFIICPPPFTREFLEWIMLLSILVWYYPLVFITLQKINKKSSFNSGN